MHDSLRSAPALLVLVLAMTACGSADVAPPETAASATPDHPAGVPAQAGGARLVTGGDAANFGVHTLAPGFRPDPHDITIVSGGDVDAGLLSLGEGCRGWLTLQPDIIVRLSGASDMLRFYVIGGDDDTTLVINAADGTYHCNDDSYEGRDPTVDIQGAGAGQYDVWVGSYQQGVRANGVLHVTELPARHP